MTNKIIYLKDYQKRSGEEFTSGEINCAGMLNAIAESKPKNAFVIAWPEDGSLPTYHSSTGDISTVLMRLNQFIHNFYNGDFDGE